jgi:hypothetical protein
MEDQDTLEQMQHATLTLKQRRYANSTSQEKAKIKTGGGGGDLWKKVKKKSIQFIKN